MIISITMTWKLAGNGCDSAAMSNPAGSVPWWMLGVRQPLIWRKSSPLDDWTTGRKRQPKRDPLRKKTNCSSMSYHLDTNRKHSLRQVDNGADWNIHHLGSNQQLSIALLDWYLPVVNTPVILNTEHGQIHAFHLRTGQLELLLEIDQLSASARNLNPWRNYRSIATDCQWLQLMSVVGDWDYVQVSTAPCDDDNYCTIYQPLRVEILN